MIAGQRGAICSYSPISIRARCQRGLFSRNSSEGNISIIWGASGRFVVTITVVSSPVYGLGVVLNFES